ncbi:HAD family hydrolase [Paraglaciecola sp. 2405UD69-4]|uniref:sulfotransferase-like domain-containing protein n=1 Tax=Paraglaciecola sp. 2405UD69-4 TaxID=3391836 RepID=UPI0039C8D54D
MTTRIAMWSGPRNISTAMMRSWENRSDCQVIDEPFYAYYLQQTQSPHPCFEDILAEQSTDYKKVVKQLTEGDCITQFQYQKHMTHHMLDDVDLGWTKSFKHCFLIRDPAQVVNSYTNSMGQCSAQDIGIIRQAELYDEITQITGQSIPVIDSNDVLKHPEYILSEVCKALAIPFDTGMLAWPKGPRESDGVWAKHWYHSVEKSTGFSPYIQQDFVLNEQQLKVVEAVQPYYEKMAKLRIKVPEAEV